MSKLSVKMKLGLGFGAILLILVAVGGIGYNATFRLSDENDKAISNQDKQTLSALMTGAIEKQTTGVRGYLLAGREDLLKHDQDGQAEFKDSSDKLEKMLVTEEGKKLFAEVRRTFDQFRAIADKEIALRRAGKSKEAEQLAFTEQTSEVRNELRKALGDLEQLEAKLAEDSIDEENGIESRTRALILVCSLFGFLLGIVVAFLIVRSITATISRMLTLIEEIAANNLAVDDMTITSEDEIGKAGIALNEMKNNLRKMIESIAGTAEHVASASEEISSFAEQQSQGAATQKDQTTQVATAMQEMSCTVLQVSENSSKASDASHKAAETARHGGDIVDQTLAKMQVIAESVRGTAAKVAELGKSSDQIGRIIGVINDIADQTNLLALNAAIEAARAGEQGRGFAVVADEVRKLAERTTASTKEIAQMIETVQKETKLAVGAMEEGTKQVEEGVQTTGKAGEALKEIIQMSEQVGDMVTHIATAAAEQSSATEQINGNMEQIANLVKESAQGAEQSAKACQELSGLAFELQKMVSNFKLGDDSTAAPGAFKKSAARKANPAADSYKPEKAMAATAR